MDRIGLNAIVFAFFTCFTVGSARAAVLDQDLLLPPLEQEFGLYSGWLLQPGYRLGQTFQVGVSGYLDSIEIQLAFDLIADTQPVDLMFSIYAVSTDGLPTGDAIASSALTRPDNIDPFDFIYSTFVLDFSDAGLLLESGSSFALVAETASLTALWGTWLYEVNDGSQIIGGNRYLDGSGIYYGPFTGNEWSSFDDDPSLVFDLSMATYMTPVPLPASIFLFLFGLSGLGVLRTRIH